MTLRLELERPGLHRGALLLPHSRDESAYGRLEIPVFSLIGGPGPTVLFTGGVHGDEYEGPLVLSELLRRLDPATLAGRVLVVPRANLPAARAGRRTSPVDGGNLARLFPGDRAAGLTAAIAQAITECLLPLADAVVDLHAGGASLEYLPCAWGRLPADPALAGRTLDLLLGFGAALTAVNPRAEGGGTLVAQALAMGIPAMAAELGGGGGVSVGSLALARSGCRNVLAALGLLPGPPPGPSPSPPPSPPPPPPGGLLGLRPAHFLHSPGFGLFEPALALGATVAEGAVAGWLHDPERPEAPPQELRFAAGGVLLCRRVPAPCVPGDVLLHLAEPTDRGALLALL